MHIYKTKLIYIRRRMGKLICGNGFKTEISAPPEFNGYKGFATPEDLFIASINSCFMLTFETICNKMGIEIKSFECECKGILKIIDGKEMFTEIIIKPRIIGKNKKGIEKAVMLAKKNCLITNSIKSKIKLEAIIVEK